MGIPRIEEARQLGDYVSSFYGAIQETDGMTFVLASTGKPHAGVRIDYAALAMGRRHRLSFVFQKTFGSICRMGGHMQMARDIVVRIDGRIVEGDWHNGVVYPDDLEEHTLTVDFTVFSEYVPGANNFLYVQPNRSVECDTYRPYVAMMTDLDLDILPW